LSRLAARRPQDLPTRVLLLDLHLDLPARDEARLDALLKEVRDLEGEEGTFWRYGKAAQLLDRPGGAGTEEARALLVEIHKRRPR
jgi:hypothetical protein